MFPSIALCFHGQFSSQVHPVYGFSIAKAPIEIWLYVPPLSLFPSVSHISKHALLAFWSILYRPKCYWSWSWSQHHRYKWKAPVLILQYSFLNHRRIRKKTLDSVAQGNSFRNVRPCWQRSEVVEGTFQKLESLSIDTSALFVYIFSLKFCNKAVDGLAASALPFAPCGHTGNGVGIPLLFRAKT